jgi:malonyl-CoA O-methyltransferase
MLLAIISLQAAGFASGLPTCKNLFERPPVMPSEDRSAPIDLALVRRLFSSPGRIAESSFLRREISGRMLERLDLVKIAPHRVLDAGCGTGADLPALQQRFGAAQVMGLDASLPLLNDGKRAQAQGRSTMQKALRRWLPAVTQPGGADACDLVCGDFAALPLPNDSIDLVWSNLALHWHPQPDKIFAEWRRVLRPDGLLMFSCFGPDTFRELRAAFAAVDDAPHALPFVDMHDFGDMLIHAGFATPVMDMEVITVTYTSSARLLADVQSLGGNPRSDRRHGLLGRQAHGRLTQRLESTRDPDGLIALTFEIIYGHAFRPANRTTAAGESIVRFEPRKK